MHTGACPSLGAHWCLWSCPCQDLPPWLRWAPDTRALMLTGARAWLPIGAYGRARVRICLRGSGARLVREPWCSLVPEAWCLLVPVVESVSGFASVAQVPAWCPSPGARWCPSLGAHWCQNYIWGRRWYNLVFVREVYKPWEGSHLFCRRETWYGTHSKSSVGTSWGSRYENICNIIHPSRGRFG